MEGYISLTRTIVWWILKGFDQNYKDAASELGDATDVTYATCMTSVAEPGQGNRSTLQQKLCSLQPVVVFSGISVM